MKLNATLTRTLQNGPKAIVEFEVPAYQAAWLKEIQSDQELTLDIKDKKETKSAQQRKYAWEIITQIDKAQNGYKSDIENTYKMILKSARIAPLHFETIPDVEPALKKLFRIVEVIENRVSDKGIPTVLFECHQGISLLDKEQMSELIDALKDHAAQVGLDFDEGTL